MINELIQITSASLTTIASNVSEATASAIGDGIQNAPNLNMIGIMFGGTLSKIVLVIIALIAARVMLWWFDSMTDFDFNEWFKNIPDAHRVAYYIARLIVVFGSITLMLS